MPTAVCVRSGYSQLDAILAHLRSIDPTTKRTRGISADEANGLYRVKRLASRIHELREQGYSIVGFTKRDTTGKRYVRYFLDEGVRIYNPDDN